MALSPRQARFVAEYATCLCAKTAAELAGYSARTARQCGSRLLALPEVMSAIKREMEQRAELVEVKAWEVLRELKRIAFSEDERTSDKLKACELLARHLRMFGTDAVVVGNVKLEDLVPRRKTSRPPDPAPSPAPPAAAPPAQPAPIPNQPPGAAAPAPAPVAPATPPEAPREDLWFPSVNAQGIGVPIGSTEKPRRAQTDFNPIAWLRRS